jgi:hypothetical protein
MQRIVTRLAVGAATAAVVPLLSACEALITRPTLYGTVTAEVVRRNGSPIAGASLVLYTGQRPMGYARTDSAGRYRFEEVPEGMYGVLAIPPSGYVRLETLFATPRPSEVVDQLEVRGGVPLSARVTFLKVGAGQVETQVREPDGTGLPGLTAVLYTPRGEFRRARTDATGRVSFTEVPFGIYGVTVERPAAYRDSGEVAFPWVDGLVMEEGSAERAQFTFERCLGTVSAQVVDQQGRGVPGATLLLYDAQAVRSRDVLPSSGQRLYTNLPCVEYGVRMLPPRGYTVREARGNAFADGVLVRRNAVKVAVLVAERVGRATVAVTVLDDQGRAVPQTRVVLYTSRALERDSQTGLNGTLLLSDILIDAEYGVRVVPPDGYTVEEARGSSYVDGIRLAADEVRAFTFRLRKRAP